MLIYEVSVMSSVMFCAFFEYHIVGTHTRVL